jgi:hypothetical protein
MNEIHAPLNVTWSKLPKPLSFSEHDPETLKRGAGGMACFLKGTEFVIFGGDEKLACEVMFNEGAQASSPVKEGFSLAGKKSSSQGINIASKQTRNMDSYLSYDIGKKFFFDFFRKENLGH